MSSFQVSVCVSSFSLYLWAHGLFVYRLRRQPLKAFKTEEKRTNEPIPTFFLKKKTALGYLSITHYFSFLPLPFHFQRLNLVNTFHIKNLSGIHVERGFWFGLLGELLRKRKLLKYNGEGRERFSQFFFHLLLIQLFWIY